VRSPPTAEARELLAFFYRNHLQEQTLFAATQNSGGLVYDNKQGEKANMFRLDCV
jgi:hypothetical protein